MYPDVERLLQLIAEGNPFQAQYIDKMKRGVMWQREFKVLRFWVRFLHKLGISVEQQAQAYLSLTEEIVEEQLYFRRNHRYIDSNSTYEDVCQSIYANGEYMSRYHIGLAIAESI